MNEILRYDLSSQNIDGSWDVIAKFPAYQRGGIVQVVGIKFMPDWEKAEMA